MDIKVYRGALDNIERAQVKSFKEKVESHPEMLGFFIGTLLEKSVRCRQTEILRYLMAQAVVHNVVVQQSKLDTLLNAAAADGQLEAVEVLLDAGADLNRDGPKGNAVLNNALGNGLAACSPVMRENYEEIFFYLISRGARANRPCHLLNMASISGCVNVVRYLLEEVIGQSTGEDIGEDAALLWAVRGGHLDVVKLLLERGDVFGDSGESGRAALREAEASGKTEIIMALREAGATSVEEAEEPIEGNAKSVSAQTNEIMRMLQGFSSQQPTVGAPDATPEALPQVPGDMINFIAKMISGEMFDDIQQQRDEWISDYIVRGRCLERETRPLKEVLRELESELSKLDPRVPHLLSPGLSDEELKSLVTNEDWVTGDLGDLYRWHNGCRNYEARELFGPYFFFSLQDSLKMRADLAGISRPYYLPIMDDGAGGWIEVDLRSEADYKGLLYEIYKESQDSPEIFPGLSAYFGAYLACVRQGAFRVTPKAGPNGEDLLVGDYQMIDTTIDRYRLRLSGGTVYPAAKAVVKDDEGDGISIRDYTVVLPARPECL